MNKKAKNKRQVTGKYCDICERITVQPKNCEDFIEENHTNTQDCIEFMQERLDLFEEEVHMKNEALALALMKIQHLEGEHDHVQDDSELCDFHKAEEAEKEKKMN